MINFIKTLRDKSDLPFFNKSQKHSIISKQNTQLQSRSQCLRDNLSSNKIQKLNKKQKNVQTQTYSLLEEEIENVYIWEKDEFNV